MTPETETSSPDAGSNGGDDSDATITRYSDTTSESNTRNWGWGRGQGGCKGRCYHQGRGRWGGRLNYQKYASLIRIFKWEVDNFGVVLGNTINEIEAKDQYSNFSEKLKQYILLEFQNTEDITILVRSPQLF